MGLLRWFMALLLRGMKNNLEFVEMDGSRVDNFRCLLFPDDGILPVLHCVDGVSVKSEVEINT